MRFCSRIPFLNNCTCGIINHDMRTLYLSSAERILRNLNLELFLTRNLRDIGRCHDTDTAQKVGNGTCSLRIACHLRLNSPVLSSSSVDICLKLFKYTNLVSLCKSNRHGRSVRLIIYKALGILIIVLKLKLNAHAIRPANLVAVSIRPLLLNRYVKCKSVAYLL